MRTLLDTIVCFTALTYLSNVLYNIRHRLPGFRVVRVFAPIAEPGHDGDSEVVRVHVALLRQQCFHCLAVEAFDRA